MRCNSLPRPLRHTGLTIAPALMFFAFLGVLLGLIRSSSAGFAVNPSAAPLDLPVVRSPHATGVDTVSGQTDTGARAVSAKGGFAVASNYGDIDPGSSITIIDLYRDCPDRTVQLGRHWRPFGVALARGESTAIVAIGSSRSLIEVDLLTGEIMRSWDHGLDGPCLVAVDPKNNVAIVAGRNSGLVTRIDLSAHDHEPVAGSASRPVRDLGAPIESLSIALDGPTAQAVARCGYRHIGIDFDRTMRCRGGAAVSAEALSSDTVTPEHRTPDPLSGEPAEPEMNAPGLSRALHNSTTYNI